MCKVTVITTLQYFHFLLWGLLASCFSAVGPHTARDPQASSPEVPGRYETSSLRQAGFTFATQGCTLPLLHACLSQEKKLGIHKKVKTSELEAAIKKLCSYSEGETINMIPENRLLLLRFSPNESSSVVIMWQLWRLVNNNPKKNKGFIVLAVFKNQVGRNVWNPLALTHDLVQKGITASSLTPPSWIIGGSEKQRAPQEIRLEIPHIKHWPWLPGLKSFSAFACFQVQEK